MRERTCLGVVLHPARTAELQLASTGPGWDSRRESVGVWGEVGGKSDGILEAIHGCGGAFQATSIIHGGGTANPGSSLARESVIKVRLPTYTAALDKAPSRLCPQSHQPTI